MLKIVHANIFLPLITAALLCTALLAQEHVRAVVPEQMAAHPSRSYSPGVDAGGYIYVSGQGPRKPDGSLPDSFDAQVKQALDNVQAVVKAAGLTIDHVVYVQVYLEDVSEYDQMNNVFTEYFGKSQPARAVLGVFHVPESPIQINAVVVPSLEGRNPCIRRITDRRTPRLPGCLRMTDSLFRACRVPIPQRQKFQRIPRRK